MTAETGMVLLEEHLEDPDLPVANLPRTPDAGRLWLRAMGLAWIVLGAFFLDRVCLLLMDYWLLESLGFASVFWTNIRVGVWLFLAGTLSSGFYIAPALVMDVGATVRCIAVHTGLMVGLLSGYFLCLEYTLFLMAEGVPFGEVDPVFGNDIKFYVFVLPMLWRAWWLIFITASLALVSSVLCSYFSRSSTPPASQVTSVVLLLGTVATRTTRVALGAFGVIAAVGWWLARYDVLIRDNNASSVLSGAAYVDVVGVFSTVNDYWVTAVITLSSSILLILLLRHCHRSLNGHAPAWPRKARTLVIAIVGLLSCDFGFKALVSLRQLISVRPNEPVIQLPYIEEHIRATREAYGLNSVETIRFVPKDVGDPLPDVEELLASPTLQNAPLWPGFVSYLEDLIDVQHRNRILQTGGDSMIYGPLLETFRQQQKLRAYYDFLDVDTIRYRIEGEPTMLVSAIREVPLVEPEPWLAWWSQQFMLFTHGMGLVTAHAGKVTPEGDPVYVSRGIPVTSAVPALQPENQRVYYGEGSGSMAYTNVRQMRELDYPTDEGRAEFEYPEDVDAGVHIDSFLKRLVFGYISGQFFEIVFSDLIDEKTRVHYFRTPIERLERVAPFLYYDTDPFAVAADGGIHWIVNGMTYTARYPYSQLQNLGDKSDRRTPFPKPHVQVNYVRDAVKATMDAFTGELKLYKFSDEPILETIAKVYPALFTEVGQMPAAIREQIQYPVQLLHIQFDDLYIIYQMNDPMYFFNMEDMWDDGDEVLGPLLDQGNAIRFSIEPYTMMVETGDGLVPEATQKTQFVQAMVFTPESALNLRSIIMVFQDGEDYGRLISLQVPKGHYFLGPEQADSAIDQEPEIAQRITWWNRRGIEVIRGHTTALPVMGEVIYLEPIFIRSQQNPVPQLKQVCVVFRGKAVMAPTLEEALREAIGAHRR